MALLTSTRTTQSVKVAHFAFSHDDTVVPKAGGAAVDFGLTNTTATTIVAIPLPVGAVVIGGYVSRTEAFDAATYNITIGDADDDNRYLAEADLKAVGTTALLTPGYIGTGQDIEVIFEAADVCTTGEAIIVVEYIVDGRADEVQVA
jgi:hypothetical protein